MTRINCIDPRELSDQHLMAEYYEIRRIAKLTRRLLNKVDSYRMGEGHLLFFYDKGRYLYKRNYHIYKELKRRGYRVDYHKYDIAKHPRGYKKDWHPSASEIAINRQRIKERLISKDDYYTWSVL